MAFSLATGFVACNSDSNNTGSTDSSSTTTTSTTATTNTPEGSVTSSGDYAAMADEYKRNSEAGKYRDARTGKTVNITVDQSTGRRLNANTREPIDRYIFVDDTDWWVYDDNGTRLGRARLENDKVMFEDSNNHWVDYDTKWKSDDDEAKLKGDDAKVKVEKDGDTKVKTDDSKVKKNEDGVKKKDN